MTEVRFRQAFLVFLVVLISAAFFAMIRAFLLTIVLAALFSGLVYPAYRRLTEILRGRQRVAALVMIVLLVALVVIPLLMVAGVVANEAVRLNDTIRPRLQHLLDQPGAIEQWLRPLPGYRLIEPYRREILTKGAEVATRAGGLVFEALSATTVATAVVIVQTIVLLYTMYFFLIDGPGLLKTVLSYLPLAGSEKQRLLERFVSVTRATLKGTVLIGVAQGALGGLAFWVVGIDGAILWATVMTVLSIIPGVGGALVWLPAAVILLSTGQVWQGIGLILFCALIVGSVDNVLRPVLVGHDIRMHELMIFFSTLGGLLMFGAMGFILGPVLAALFVTIWNLFGAAFSQELGEGAARDDRLIG